MMEEFDTRRDATVPAETPAVSPAYAEVLAAQMGSSPVFPSPFRPTGEGSSVLQPPRVGGFPPAVPGLDTAPRDTTPAAPRETTPAVPRDTTPVAPGAYDRAAKASDVADTIKNRGVPVDQVIRKIEAAFRTEPDRAAMSDLARRVNEQLTGTGIRLDVSAFRNHRTNSSVYLQGFGRPVEIPVGPGTGVRLDVAPTVPQPPRIDYQPPRTDLPLPPRTDYQPPRTDYQPPRTDLPQPPRTDYQPPRTDLPQPPTADRTRADDRAAKAQDLAYSLKSEPVNSVIGKLERAFGSETDAQAMSILAQQVNQLLADTNIRLSVQPFRGHRSNMAVTIHGFERAYEIPVGPGTGRRVDIPAAGPRTVDVPPVGPRTDLPLPPRPDYQPPRPDYQPPRPDYQPPRTDYQPPRTDYQPPRADYQPPARDAGTVHDRSAEAQNLAYSLKSEPIDSVITKLQNSFRSQSDPSAMADLAQRVNQLLSDTNIRLSVQPFRNNRANMSVAVHGLGRAYEIPVGPGTGRR